MAELNAGLHFMGLIAEDRKTFLARPLPALVRIEKGLHLYKWTGYKLALHPRTGFLTQFWLPWEGLKVGDHEVPSFKELRIRYANVDGGVGRPQEFARARNAVTHQWNEMSSILKVELRVPVWGFAGVTAPQRFYKDEKQPWQLANVTWIGGDYQLCIPNLTFDHVTKI